MEERTILTFSLRLAVVDPMDLVRDRVASALGCPMTGGEYAGVSAFVGEVLEMRIGLLHWRGIGGALVYELHGAPDFRSISGEPAEIRIDRAVIDLLAERGAGRRRLPSREEKIAASKYDVDDM